MSKRLRILPFGVCLAICLGCWAWTFGTLIPFRPSGRRAMDNNGDDIRCRDGSDGLGRSFHAGMVRLR